MPYINDVIDMDRGRETHAAAVIYPKGGPSRAALTLCGKFLSDGDDWVTGTADWDTGLTCGHCKANYGHIKALGGHHGVI